MNRSFGSTGSLFGLSLGQPIRGVRVDNYTGQWLHLRGYALYVPPYTLNWAEVLPGAQSVDVVVGDSPAGTPTAARDSSDTSVYEIELWTEPIEPSPGRPAGTQSEATEASVEINSGLNTIDAIEGGSANQIIVAALAGLRRPIIRIIALASLTSVPLLGPVEIRITGITPNQFVRGAISPENPMWEWLPAPGTAAITQNTALQASGVSAPGCGAQRVHVLCTYYGKRASTIVTF